MTLSSPTTGSKVTRRRGTWSTSSMKRRTPATTALSKTSQLSGHNNVNNSNVAGRNKPPTTATIKPSNKRVNKTKILTLRNKITTLKAILPILAMANSGRTAKYLITHKKNAERERETINPA